MVDLESAGALRALVNFILPRRPTLHGPQRLQLTQTRPLDERARHRAWVAACEFIRRLHPCYLYLVQRRARSSGRPLEHLLYGGRMASHLGGLPWLALASLLSGIGMAFSTPLRAAQNSQHALFAGIAATIVGLGSSLILLPRYGLQGAFISLVLANGAACVVVVGTYAWMLVKNPVDWASQGRALVIFDENLTPTSPVGSCLLKVVETNTDRYPLHLYYNRLDLSKGEFSDRTHSSAAPRSGGSPFDIVHAAGRHGLLVSTWETAHLSHRRSRCFSVLPNLLCTVLPSNFLA